MRAFVLDSPRGTPALRIIPRPTPARGEVLVRIAAAGLNFADLLMLKGQYQDTPPTPFTPGA
jgi:NADPH:quinone reductase